MTVSQNFSWTDENVSELRRLYAKGYSALQIMPFIGAPSRNTVIGKISRLGLSRAVEVEPVNQHGTAKPKQPMAPKVKAPPQPKPKTLKVDKTLTREERQEAFVALADKALERFEEAVSAARGDESGVLFLDRGRNQCAMPLPGWDDASIYEKRTCGRPVKVNRCADGTMTPLSYCATCAALVYVPSKFREFKDGRLKQGVAA
jgi:hypothetical protein